MLLQTFLLLYIDYLKHLPEGHPDVNNSKGSLINHHYFMLIIHLFDITAALAVISETAAFMNSEITELVH